MTLRYFVIFICVCDENSMTRAAEKMHISQPSISQAIAEIEEHYRVRLFERLNRKLFLTSAGQTLLTYARHIVNLNQQIETSMQQFYHTYHLRIGASLTIGECLLIDLLKKLYEFYPNNKITSAVYNTAVLEKMLLEDALDIALIEGRVQSEYLTVVPFMRDALIFVAASNHPLAKEVNIPMETIAACSFLVRESGSGTRALFEQVMNMHDLKYSVVGTYNNAETIKKAVCANFGITVISELSVRDEIANGTMCKLSVENLSFQRNFSIVYHKNKYMSSEMEKVMELCQTFK